MKSIIINPFTPIPKSDRSHVKGWAKVWAQRLDADIGNKDTVISGYDKIYIDHGVNFSGALNLFGGFNDEVFDRCDQLITAVKSGSKLISLDRDVTGIAGIDYSGQIDKRLGSKTTSPKLDKAWLWELDEVLFMANTLKMSDLKLPKGILGDSHAIAFSTQDQKIDRRNGQTLYSALGGKGLVDFIKNSFVSGSSEIDLCLGSIDIRHHVFRNEVSAKDFAKRYADDVIFAQDYFETAINVCGPVPIEYADRKIPKTGQYKGENYCGSVHARSDYTAEFLSILYDYMEFDTIIPPYEWYTMDSEQYAKEIMEMGSSVHISPLNYRSILGWE